MREDILKWNRKKNDKHWEPFLKFFETAPVTQEEFDSILNKEKENKAKNFINHSESHFNPVRKCLNSVYYKDKFVEQDLTEIDNNFLNGKKINFKDFLARIEKYPMSEATLENLIKKPNTTVEYDIKTNPNIIKQSRTILDIANKLHKQDKYEAQPNAENTNNENTIQENIMQEIKLLKAKPQIILQGSPGTGKTRKAKEIAYYLIKNEPLSDDEKQRKEQLQALPKEKYRLIQFHPAYSYEDFVRGIVAKTDDGAVSYEVQNKVLAEMAENALDNPNDDFVLIIDEINRANLPAVLGELIYALEYRGEAVESMYEYDNSRKITLPKNLYIIGTMNTADRSVGHIDYAIRRRFAFVQVNTDETVIKNAKALILFGKIKTLFDKKLSEEFDQDDVMIGHSYFLNDNLEAALKYEIKPILYEYVKDGVLTCEKSVIDNLNGGSK